MKGNTVNSELLPQICPTTFTYSKRMTLSRPLSIWKKIHVTRQFREALTHDSLAITYKSNQFNLRLQKNDRSPQIRTLSKMPPEESTSSISNAWLTRFDCLPSAFGMEKKEKKKGTLPQWGLNHSDLNMWRKETNGKLEKHQVWGWNYMHLRFMNPAQQRSSENTNSLTQAAFSSCLCIPKAFHWVRW